MSTAIRAAIIGLGNSSKGKGGAHSISYCHGWAYKADSRVDLVAACSRGEKNVADFIQEFPGFLPTRDAVAASGAGHSWYKKFEQECQSLCHVYRHLKDNGQSF